MTMNHSAAHAEPIRELEDDGVAFVLERFAWEAPDRLEVCGWFSGVGSERPAPPVLIVHGPDGTHRLPTVPGSVSGPPEDGRRWRAAFAWQEPPTAFASAELHLGPRIAIALPDPHAEAPGSSRTGAERLRLQAELLAAQQETREARAGEERAREELARAREDLEADRDRHAADAERFRDGLASVRASAERELDVLRDRLTLFERDGEEVERLRAELESAHADQAAAHARLRRAQRPVADARAVAEAMIDRLAAIEDELEAAQDR